MSDYQNNVITLKATLRVGTFVVHITVPRDYTAADLDRIIASLQAYRDALPALSDRGRAPAGGEA